MSAPGPNFLSSPNSFRKRRPRSMISGAHRMFCKRRPMPLSMAEQRKLNAMLRLMKIASLWRIAMRAAR